jgi:hypothetical protein
MSKEDYQNAKVLQTYTGWGIIDCIALLRKQATLQAAQAYYDDGQKKISEFSEERTLQCKQLAKTEKWANDLLNSNFDTKILQKASDPIHKR